MEHIIVTRFHRELISNCSCKAFVIITENMKDLAEIREAVSRRNKLHCVYLRPGKALDKLEYTDDLAAGPVALAVPEAGKFRSLAHCLPRLRGADLRVVMEANRENLVSTRILSSLGINCALNIDGGTVDLEALGDLLTYLVYGKTRHATVEPFHSIIREYSRDKLRFFPSAVFEDPARYLHCGEDGRLALTGKDLAEGNYVGELDSLGAVKNSPAYLENMSVWREHFLAVDSCSKCPGWRICGGAFASSLPGNPGCEKFFSELLEAAEFDAKNRKGIKKEIWQI